MTKHFVIVVDAQNDFMRAAGSLYVPHAEGIISNIENWLKEQTEDNCAGILFTYDTHDKNSYPQSEEAKQFPPHCYIDTDGWNLAVDSTVIKPGIPVYTLKKNVFNMWEQEKLFIVQQANSNFDRAVMMRDRDAFFTDIRSEGNGKIPIDQKNANDKIPLTDLYILGVAADFCVSYAIKGALKFGFKIHVPENCTAGINKNIDEILKEFNI